MFQKWNVLLSPRFKEDELIVAWQTPIRKAIQDKIFEVLRFNFNLFKLHKVQCNHNSRSKPN